MNEPKLWLADDIKKYDISAKALAYVNGKVIDDWVLVRPLSMGRFAIFYRLKLAYGVFTGKYDVLRWRL